MRKGTIVQIKLKAPDQRFRGMLMVISSIKEWGCVGYFMLPDLKFNGAQLAFYRAKWDDIIIVGHTSVMFHVDENVLFNDKNNENNTLNN